MQGGGEEARPGAREGYEGGRTLAPPMREFGGGGEGEGEGDGVAGGGEAKAGPIRGEVEDGPR